MYVHSVKLINFKSIGDYPESEIIVEPKITAIIGKNESGKSNILDGLSRIDFQKANAKAFTDEIINRNRINYSEKNRYVITLKPNNKDKEMGICSDTLVEISKEQCLVTGGVFEYYLNNVLTEFKILANFLNQISQNPMQLRDQELANYNTYKQELLKEDKLDLYLKKIALNFLKDRLTRISTEYRESFEEKVEAACNAWTTISCMFPVFFYRKADKHLNTSYKIDDIEKELKGPTVAPNSLLYDFVKLIEIPFNSFIIAARGGTTPQQVSLRGRINKAVNNKINVPFQKFYQNETINLDLDFNAGTVLFNVQSGDGEKLILSERSNGLKWYLETFIDAQANDIADSNVVYLFDEPGISLHVNAQRELLSLFRHLSDKGNQVVYTTHSPYMLDLEVEGIHRIRAVVKSKEGFSRIYKTAYDARISPDSQQDTLAPIISALGMNLNDTFGPAKDKLNIVTEGISDYIFLCTMAKILDVDTERYAIIPSTGVTNCVKICSILHGWGCRYIALFDYDKEGVESGGEYMRKEMMFEYNRQYCYVKDVFQDDVDNKTYNSSYMIEDCVTREEIDRYCNETNTPNTNGKPLMAKLMCTAIEDGSFQVGEKCKANFKKLFERIFLYLGK